MTIIRQLPIILVLVVLVLLAFMQGCVQSQLIDISSGPESNGISAEAFFCPADACEQRVAAAIESAEHSVDVAIYSFTSREIYGALMRAHDKGARVRVVADALQASSGSSIVDGLEGEGVEVRLFPKGVTMHNKFAVIDNSLVITGSYNWTKNASYYNRENLVMLFGKGLAGRYGQEFFRLWVEAG